MRIRPNAAWLTACILSLALAADASAQSRGVKVISATDMKPAMKFLGAREFRGRSAPSVELDIASSYIAIEAARIGLKPLMPDGTYLQQLPVEVTTVSPARSLMRIIGPGGELLFRFPQAFSATPQGGEWMAGGSAVFAGSALSAPEPKWDDTPGIDVRGRFVVMLETPPPAGGTSSPTATAITALRTRVLRQKGAIGLITIISRERERNFVQKQLTFDVTERLRFLDVETFNPPPLAPQAGGPSTAQPPAPEGPFHAVQLRHEAGAALLGVSLDELGRLFDSIERGRPVPPRAILSRTIDFAVFCDQRQRTTPNVVAYLPGTDPKLKNEYIVIGSHHDHNPPREGRIFPGADDNVSGAAGMLEIARAMMVERPRRSVIFVWHTAEERGLVGAYYFVQHCPVPVQRISANLNLDMISRNDPNGIYLIGSNKVSSELDRSLRDVNSASLKLTLDYKYEDPGEPSRFFFRSDQYPYIRYGIPGVWLFSGTTADYHTEGDSEDKVDYGKMEKIVRFTYLVAMDIGNKPALLKLDVHPEIKTRGPENMNIVWQTRATATR